jgi:hypothetical protein
MKIKGYNEALVGYGVEDVDLFDRLIKVGLRQMIFENVNFYGAIQHPCNDRILQENSFINLNAIYISYTTPYITRFLLLHKDNTCEDGSLVNNLLYYYNEYTHYSNRIEATLDAKNRIILEGSIHRGVWDIVNNRIRVILNNNVHYFEANEPKIKYDNVDFYRMQDTETLSWFLINLSDAKNYDIKNKQKEINLHGFGKGIVYKNFDYTTPIILD